MNGITLALDDAEPLLTPALARAAKTSPSNGSAMPSCPLARELNVAPRTLQRAFAASGETAGTCIKRCRME